MLAKKWIYLLLLMLILVTLADAKKRKKRRRKPGKRPSKKRKPGRKPAKRPAKRPAKKPPPKKKPAAKPAATTAPPARADLPEAGVAQNAGKSIGSLADIDLDNIEEKIFLSDRYSKIRYGQTRDFVTCEIELSNGKFVYPLVESAKIPTQCKRETVQIVSFWAKPDITERVMSSSGQLVTMSARFYVRYHVCKVTANPILVALRGRRCSTGFTAAGYVYALNANMLKRSRTLETLRLGAEFEPKVHKISIYARFKPPYDNRILIDDEGLDDTALVSFKKWVAEAYVPYAGAPEARNLVWPKNEKLAKKYLEREAQSMFAHGQTEDGFRGLEEPGYQFSKSKFTKDGYSPLHALADGDVTAFKLLKNRLPDDTELVKLSFCGNADGKFQIVVEGECQENWELHQDSYAFGQDAGDTIPDDAFKVFLYQRRAAPLDSKLTRSRMVQGADPQWILVTHFYALPAFTELKVDPNFTEALIRSTTISVKWDEVRGAYGYNIDIYPRPMDWIAIRQIKNPQYVFKNLQSDTTYKIKVEPFVRKNEAPIIASTFLAVQKTSTEAPTIFVAEIASTRVSLKWDIQENVKYYMMDLEEQESNLRSQDDTGEEVTMYTKPDTVYKISITGVIDKDRNIFTDTVDVTVKTSPLPPTVAFQTVDRKQARISWAGLNGFNEYHFSVDPPIPGAKTEVYKSGQSFVVKPPRNTKYRISMVAKDTRSNRVTDRRTFSRIYSFCQFTRKDLFKLNCKPKRKGLEHKDGFDWMMNDNGKFQTYDDEIDLNTVKILHVQNNNISDGEHLSYLFDQLPQVWLINAQNNSLTGLPGYLLSKTRKLQKISFSGNQLEQVYANAFRGAPKTLFKLDLSGNPLSHCGVSQDTIAPVKKQLTVLDLHDTGVKTQVRGVLNAWDLENGGEGPSDPAQRNKPSKYSQMCSATDI